MHPTRQKLRRGILVALFLLLPITLNYYSPYLMTYGTAMRVASFSLFFWAIVLLSSPLIGRAFCGWGCPFNGLQTAWESVSVRPLVKVRFLAVTKYALWVAWVAGVAWAAIATGGWQRVDPLFMTEHYVSIDSAGNLVTYFMLVGLTLAPVALGRRGFCRYFCPFGVWAVVGEKLGYLAHVPRLRLIVDREKCTNCATCTRACPMQLPVAAMVASEQMRTTECISCGSCADGCRQGAIRWGFGRPR
jgi:ferredoxin-type protein NapH